MQETRPDPILFYSLIRNCSLNYWFLVLAAYYYCNPFFLVATFKPAKQVCPKCNWEYPVPLSQREQQHVEEMVCPLCAEPIRKEAIKCRHCGSEISVSTTRSNNSINLQKQDNNYKDTLAYKAGKIWEKMTK